ncbi:BSD domain-containing protein 1 [Danio rerio]|uniref:BSD domain-containing protein 1 n=2 Tax=Danio rerio TaxID=7955 RepID=BSDC1_DANRE|nr:BSD domain-containing protein 1 [Danio rerio]A2BIJ3.1 RecName: Full=BSD domain-containing protein 1 [Danio rerio]AAI55162.1 BSD domain containing 1 [Danio rerio]|eukprot:NP_001004108.2 BSD domain-containing protein 1 [Danio rerio]
MADGEGGWWGGWLTQSFQSVKDKSAEAYEFIKRDLTEFSSVVQHDTACSVVATANAIKSKLAVEGSSETTEKVKKGITNILGVITDTLAPPPDKTIDCDVITLVATPTGTTEVYDSGKARLYSLQADPATYCNEPDGPPQQFDSWLSTFSLEERKAEISELLVSSPAIRALYTKMVPAAVAHAEFWQRYFYKVFQLEQEEARRVALKQRAEQTDHSESLGWEEEDEEGEFLGATSLSRLDFTPPVEESRVPAVTVADTPESSSPPQAVASLSNVASDVTPSVSSDSVSFPTQIENQAESVTIRVTQPSPAADELSQKLSDTGLQETFPEERPAPREETAREDMAQDLRVFELNSDSGKSTPSNNGKKGSSTDVSEDWEKDFDLDMTEEEVQMALSKVDATEELEDEDWENWE